MDEVLKQTLLIVSNHSHGGYKDFDILKRLLDKATNEEKTKNCEGYMGDPENIKQTYDKVLSVRQKWPICRLRILQQSMLKPAHNRINNILQCNFGLANIPIVIVHHVGRDWLIDGGNRINFWNSNGDCSKKLNVNYHSFLAVGAG